MLIVEPLTYEASDIPQRRPHGTVDASAFSSTIPRPTTPSDNFSAAHDPLCCNMLLTKRLEKLQSSEFQEALDYLCDPLVIEGLRKIKEFGSNYDGNNYTSAPNAMSGFQGSLANVPVQQKPPHTTQFNPSNLNLNTGNVLSGQNMPTPEIKQENSSSGAKGLSIDDFNSFGNRKTIGSPLNKTLKRTMGAGRGNTPKKQKTVSNTELYSSLAELKRECIRKVNALLKTFKPANDPNAVIWTEVNRLNRGIVVGPKSPHS
ncbi:MAG: hypothetical protein MJE68_25750, partial [Proteobacteria bacterium]|nr:hypothetical protein [Pseudomonadota bacterium]